MKTRIFRLCYAIGALLFTGCSTLTHTKSQTTPLAPETPSFEEASAPQDVSRDISSQLVAVQLYTDGQWAGSGTLLLDAEGKPDRIVTSAHIFWTGFGPRIYEYRVVGSDRRGFISNVNPRPIPEPVDIAVCEIGEPRLVGGNSEFGGGIDFEKRVDAERYREPIPVTSGSTKKRATVIGVLREANGTMNYVITYPKPVPGESGSGFYDNTGRLFVLRSDMKITSEVRQFFELPDDCQALSVAILVTLTASN